MSAKNKLQNKVARKAERESRVEFERRGTGTSVPYEEATEVLCDPKQRLSGPSRRGLMYCRSSILVMPQPVVRPFAVKLAEKLASLKLAQVIRRRSQFATRAAGAKYKLAALSPNSRFRPALQRIQDANLFAFKQAEAELEARKLHALGQLVSN